MSELKTVAGIDFGTSNSAIALANSQKVSLVNLQGGETMPTTIFVELEGKTPGNLSFGQEAIDKAYGRILQPDGSFIQGDRMGGRLLRGLKSLLGSSTLNQQLRVQDEKGYNHTFFFHELIGKVITELKTHAEKEAGKELQSAVFGRPVHFVDNNEERDAEAEEELRKIALKAGFENVEFLYEPIAAALAYEAQLSSESLAAVVDVGGGTTDVSIIRLSPDHHFNVNRSGDILANAGVHVGGTDFDSAIGLKKVAGEFGRGDRVNGDFVPYEFFTNLTTWQLITRLYTRKTLKTLEGLLDKAGEAEERRIGRFLYVVEMQEAHLVLGAIEDAKIELSSSLESAIDLSGILQKKDPLKILMSQDELIGSILAQPLQKIQTALNEALTLSGVKADAIESVFLTGGPSAMPEIQEMVQRTFPSAELVRGNRLSAVGHGLGIAARNIFI